MKIGFIGAGRVGFSLGRMFAENDLPLAGYFSRTPESARDAAEFSGTQHFETMQSLIEACDVLFLTVPDGSIGPVWEKIRGFHPAGKLICHCSGSISSTVFRGIDECGAFGFSVHPLLAVSDRYGSYRELPDALFTIEGAKAHLSDVCGLLSACGCRYQVIAAKDKVRYHAAAVMASNLVVSLADCAIKLLEECGFSDENARAALSPLMKGNLDAVLSRGPAAALTGPIERGDVGTVKKHLDVLGNDPETREIYRVLSLRAADVSRAAHPGRNDAALRELLSRS
jgi:predicted short-subunit dehydrogenase-like oxidoreductase (DUF2520 family)